MSIIPVAQSSSPEPRIAPVPLDAKTSTSDECAVEVGGLSRLHTQVAATILPRDGRRRYSQVVGLRRVKEELLTAATSTYPKLACLCGTSGTGKTLLIWALANECETRIYRLGIEDYVRGGAALVRAVYADAKTHQPAIISVDEADWLFDVSSDTVLSRTAARPVAEEIASLDVDDHVVTLAEVRSAPQTRDVCVINVPMPSQAERTAHILRLFPSFSVRAAVALASLAHGLPGSELVALHKEVLRGGEDGMFERAVRVLKSWAAANAASVCPTAEDPAPVSQRRRPPIKAKRSP